MSGIGVQQAVLLAFLALMITFHVRALREGKTHDTRWQPLTYTLYGSLALISVRNPYLPQTNKPTNPPQIRIIFRLVEFSSGIYGPIPTNESYFYGLEATPMFLALFSLAVIHPGRYLRGPGSEFTKPIVTKGAKRWWCCGRRKRTRVHPDYDAPKTEGRQQSDGENSWRGERTSDVPLTAKSDGVYDRHDYRTRDVPLTAQFPYRESV